jgi:uncharacterized membrane protein HdeD (DUF308 family)
VESTVERIEQVDDKRRTAERRVTAFRWTLGIVMFSKPGDGALVLLALIAAFALVNGASQLVLAIGGKRLLERDLRSSFRRLEPKTP